jgi:hypothetical protein
VLIRLLIVLFLFIPTPSYSSDIRTFGRTCFGDNQTNKLFCNKLKSYENSVFGPVNSYVNNNETISNIIGDDVDEIHVKGHISQRELFGTFKLEMTNYIFQLKFYYEDR